MIYLLAGILVFTALTLLARWATYAKPADVTQLFYRIGGVALAGFAAFLMLRGQWVLGAPIAVMAISMFRRKPDSVGADREQGRGSTVRTAALEMTLDHDTGQIIGRVLAGTYEGRDLDGLQEAELVSLWQEIGSDQESLDLLEAYLDGRRPGWRDEFEPDMTAREGSATHSGTMTEEEAYQLLGLAPGASEAEIVAAHRRLMLRVHPDQGGSTFLAAKINAAKAVLLGKHG